MIVAWEAPDVSGRLDASARRVLASKPCGGLPRELWLGCLEGEIAPDFLSEANGGLPVSLGAPPNIERLCGVRPRELGVVGSAPRGVCAPQVLARESRLNCGRAGAGASSFVPSSQAPSLLRARAVPAAAEKSESWQTLGVDRAETRRRTIFVTRRVKGSGASVEVPR